MRDRKCKSQRVFLIMNRARASRPWCSPHRRAARDILRRIGLHGLHPCRLLTLAPGPADRPRQPHHLRDDRRGRFLRSTILKPLCRDAGAGHLAKGGALRILVAARLGTTWPDRQYRGLGRPKRDEIAMNRHRALGYGLSMISAFAAGGNRFRLFRIVAPAAIYSKPRSRNSRRIGSGIAAMVPAAALPRSGGTASSVR
jgi:hypothetical protein